MYEDLELSHTIPTKPQYFMLKFGYSFMPCRIGYFAMTLNLTNNLDSIYTSFSDKLYKRKTIDIYLLVFVFIILHYCDILPNFNWFHFAWRVSWSMSFAILELYLDMRSTWHQKHWSNCRSRFTEFHTAVKNLFKLNLLQKEIMHTKSVLITIVAII